MRGFDLALRVVLVGVASYAPPAGAQRSPDAPADASLPAEAPLPGLLGGSLPAVPANDPATVVSPVEAAPALPALPDPSPRTPQPRAMQPLPPPAANPNPVVLVMESGGGVRAAVELRAFLNRQPNLHVVSLADAARQHQQPAAIVTVATEPSRMLRVVYWDLGGGSDALTSPTPAKPEEVGPVVMALTSALLERHRPELNPASPAAALASRTTGFDNVGSSRAFYAMLGRFNRLIPRTNVELRFEDF